ncbi:MAG: hypothetical protein VKN56_09380 [Cyanobacteriota bacterium]|nr:hypothetical protein [Cyanobacteriota bacterium]
MLQLALLVAGIASPIQQLLVFEKASPTQKPSAATKMIATEAAMKGMPHCSWSVKRLLGEVLDMG